uniref:Vicilin-like seed storage protein At2g18540 n=1 Tax=Diabrotica virgifera virgifera TaxID=50390 RepID=A0A6P7F775_DIAVI
MASGSKKPFYNHGKKEYGKQCVQETRLQKKKKEDDYRQKKQDEAKTNKNENGEELSHDGKKTKEIEERKKFEEEMLKRHQNQPKINRSGPITHSTLLDNMLEETNREEEEKEGDAEEREPSAEAIEVEGEENKREDQTETHWQKTGDSILQALLFDDEDYEAIQQSKKRKGDSLEENERFKKEKREETAEYPEETENERILRKLKQEIWSSSRTSMPTASFQNSFETSSLISIEKVRTGVHRAKVSHAKARVPANYDEYVPDQVDQGHSPGSDSEDEVEIDEMLSTFASTSNADSNTSSGIITNRVREIRGSSLENSSIDTIGWELLYNNASTPS